MTSLVGAASVVAKAQTPMTQGTNEPNEVDRLFKRLHPREHVLKRPHVYLGPCQVEKSTQWTVSEKGRMEWKAVDSSIGLLKIFDEILVNATDVHQDVTKKMTKLRVTVCTETGVITVWNDGKTIPVEMHTKEKMWAAELVFGELLAGANFDDDKQRVVGGQNGMGAKLTNILSSEFEVQCNDVLSNQKWLRVRWSQNMEVKEKAHISKSKGKTDWTSLSFKPDYARFGLPSLTPDMASLFYKRTLDAAGTCHGLKVEYNSTPLKMSWRSYCALYLTTPSCSAAACSTPSAAPVAFPSPNVTTTADETNVSAGLGRTVFPSVTVKTPVTASASPAICEKRNVGNSSEVDKQLEKQLVLWVEPVQAGEHRSRWEVCIGVSPEGSGFRQVSFANGVCTTDGGTHVTAVTDAVVHGVFEYYHSQKRKKQNEALKPAMIRSNLFVFVNCVTENPEFSNQMKDKLVNKRAKLPALTLGSSAKFVQQVSGLLAARIEQAVAEQEQRELRKQDKALGKTQSKGTRLTGVPKLEDANKAGDKKGLNLKCKLILTEGDSAKSLAMAGLAITGRDYFGVFPLRGKPRNAQTATHAQLVANAEFGAIKQILGLVTGKDYTTPEAMATLRYGQVLIFADADHDGTHIAGLIINIFATHWPSLFRKPGFLSLFITPIVKVTLPLTKSQSLSKSLPDNSKSKKKAEVLSFYTLDEFEQWLNSQEETSAETKKKWQIKYYKGLGTSTAEEGREYFSQLQQHQIAFEWHNESDDAALRLAFGKDSNARKTWLTNYIRTPFREKGVTRVRYLDFINKELILFSVASNVRAIASVMDGLKPGQRKILFACLKRNLVREIKVAQLAGYVSEHAAYHHGEASLCQTIVGLAQNFVGSNNLSLLVPSGQFGDRGMGSEGAASPRYIFTALHPLTRCLFSADDDALLEYVKDDGDQVEPVWYAPILPIVLINGNQGIGTGWSSFVPCYNPKDLIQAILCLLDQKPVPPLHPWYRGFKGHILPAGSTLLAPLVSTALVSTRQADASTPSVEKKGKGRVVRKTPKDNADGLLYDVVGLASRDSRNKKMVRITELPVAVWTETYRDKVLVNMMKTKISRFEEFHGKSDVNFLVEMTHPVEDASPKALTDMLGLHQTLSLRNMMLFDSRGKLRKFTTAEEILREFYETRLELFNKRRTHLLGKMARKLALISNKVRFVLAVVSDELKIRNVAKRLIVQEMKTQKYDEWRLLQDSTQNKVADGETDGWEGECSNEVKVGQGIADDVQAIADEVQYNENDTKLSSGCFDYLLRMPLSSLTLERVQELKKEQGHIQSETTVLQNKSGSDMWRAELAVFSVKWEEYLKSFDDDNDMANSGSTNAKGSTSKRKSKGQGKGESKGDSQLKRKRTAPAENSNKKRLQRQKT